MKKANLTLGAVLGLLMVIIVFVPAIILAAKLIGGGGGNQNNFETFISDLASMKNVLPVERRATEAILAKESAFVYFEPGQKYVGMVTKNLKPCISSACSSPPLLFERPSSCEEEACLCFIYKIKTEMKNDPFLINRYEGEGLFYYKITTINPTCRKVDFIAQFKNCGVGTPVTPNNAYQKGFTNSCLHGFVIDREIAPKVLKGNVLSENYPYFDAPKRIPFQMHKEGETIVLEY
ncbi:hypothetical protein J4421_06240 [Candidatus Woesearchaeota archaeon]|nr:hypothetical protein [Candidatus Woesearchaeota archaeon]